MRVYTTGGISMAKPCMDCINKLKMYSRLRYVYYSTRDGYVTREHIDDIHNSHRCAAIKRKIALGIK